MQLRSILLQCFLMMIIISNWLVMAENQGTDFCRVWNIWNASECRCAPVHRHEHVTECNADQTDIEYKACATYDSKSQATLVGVCPFNSHELQLNKKLSSTFWVENVNLTAFMCDPLNRTGVLCSLCKAGLGPALLNYSHPCLECTSYGWVAYFAATLIPSS